MRLLRPGVKRDSPRTSSSNSESAVCRQSPGDAWRSPAASGQTLRPQEDASGDPERTLCGQFISKSCLCCSGPQIYQVYISVSAALNKVLYFEGLVFLNSGSPEELQESDVHAGRKARTWSI